MRILLSILSTLFAVGWIIENLLVDQCPPRPEIESMEFALVVAGLVLVVGYFVHQGVSLVVALLTDVFASLKRRLAVILLPVLLLAAPTKAHAGASILGFSVGDDTMTLGAILSQAIQQVKLLSDIAAVTKVMTDNIAFIRDVYETGNDLVNGRWQVLTDIFVNDVLSADENLREIIRNTEQMVTGRVPRSNKFRRLLGAGFEHVLFEAFGPYPFGDPGQWAAMGDLSSLRLNNLADEQMRNWREEHRRIEQSIRECAKTRSFQVCQSAADRAQIQSTQQLEQIKAIEAHRAKAEAVRMGMESGDRKQKVLGAQADVTDIAEAAMVLGDVSSLPPMGFP